MNTNFFALLAASTLAFSATASAAPETLFGGDGTISHGGFAAPLLKVTHIDGHSRVLVGLEGAWIVNHALYVGLSGVGMAKGIETNVVDSAGDRQYMHMGYGGILLGMTFGSDKLLHFAFQNVIGGGNAILTPSKWDDGENNQHDECDWDEDTRCSWNDTPFFVWEPNLQAEINITNWMRIAAGAGYRFTWTIEEKNGYEGNDLGGLTASLAFKFGKF